MTEPPGPALDRRYLAAALRLGSGGLGTTWPNPAVGAILVKDGRVVGRGRTAPGGRPHGETAALAEAGASAAGATLYVSLEPCSHQGRTPPCADAIIAAGIARVAALIADPDPRVGGQGFERLERAGIAVDAGGQAAEAIRAHCGHLSRVLHGRPHILLKLAVSADEAIGRRGEGGISVTGDIARRHVQALRSRYDAILVGRGTVEADDPQLTCRLPGLENRSPVRVILDTEGRLSGREKAFLGSSPTWLLTAGPESGDGRVRRLQVERAPGGLDLAAGLARLAGEGVTRLLVEGGARVARAFLEADLVDEVMLFRSPAGLGRELIPALAGLPMSTVEAGGRFRRTERRRFGPDRMSRYERVR